MTVIPLVFLIAHGWRQQQLAENARELGTVVETLGDRLHVFEDHLHSVGAGIRKAVENWNKATASWQRRVEPQIEKIRDLGGKLKQGEGPEAVDPDMPLLVEKRAVESHETV